MDDSRLCPAVVDMSGPNAQTPNSRESSKNTSSSVLGKVPLSLRIWLYGLSFLAVLLVVLPWLAHRIDVYWPAVHIDIGPLRYVGLVIFIPSFIVYVRASFFLTSQGEGAYVEFDPPTKFVATGMYRWVRNPIAASAVAMLLGEAILFSSTGIALLFLIALAFAHMQVVFLEEPLLQKRFGQEYEAYRASVPRWIPRRPRQEQQ
jgi:protein-S-isoprenylcysteine O-methyltransferase Ste14